MFRVSSTPIFCLACRRGKPHWPNKVFCCAQPILPAPDIGFRRTELDVYLFGRSFLPVLNKTEMLYNSLSLHFFNIYIYLRGCPQATMDRPQAKAGTAALLVALAAEGRGASRHSVFDGSGSGGSIFMDDDPMPVDAGDSFGSVPGVEHAVAAATLQPARFWPAELDAIDELYHCAERPDGGSFKAIPRADMR